MIVKDTDVILYMRVQYKNYILLKVGHETTNQVEVDGSQSKNTQFYHN